MIETIHQKGKSSRLVFGLAWLAILQFALAGGCARTVAEQPAVASQVASGKAPNTVTGFFGDDYSKLQPGGDGQVAMLYINPNVNWSQYDKVLLEPIEFWGSENSNVPYEEQQMLAAYAYSRMKQDLQEHFTLVDKRGPGVLILRAALNDATAATPGLRSVSVAIPQAELLNGLQSLATGSYAFVGSAEGEMRLNDSMTNELLMAGIDKRAGGIALTSVAQWKWGDAKAALDYWGKRITNRLLELQGRKS
ncbi:MAG TPA: DUF3313 domain-containing protein [Candidatus Binataceae bacterium]|nr:DUF3313 domain-containing protein [Candidatus Binataceae bacterium]